VAGGLTVADEKNPEEKTKSASDKLGESLKTPLHDQVFGSDPDGGVNDTPPGASGKRVVHMNLGAQPDGVQPMLQTGDTDRHH
jgi:hypothetical protein